MTKEEKFFNALRDIFIGAKVEGQSGFVNLMKIKSNYYLKIEKLLQEDINNKIQKYPDFKEDFKEDLFDKLYSFFNRYFTESGSIYFNQTPFHNNVYEKVYTDNKDVILFWKTHMLYYVKTDRIFKSIPVEFDNLKFYFDASEVEHKKANEKKELIYKLKEIKDDKTIVFNVLYSERGKKTKIDEILKEIIKNNIKLKEEDLEKAFKVFEKQSEVDFFINKDAKGFLKEQFKLWLYQYMFDDKNIWILERIEQLQILKEIAYKIIDFISQFEDELVKIWNKPKFVLNSNYVITLDRIAEYDKELTLINKVLDHKNFINQINEWKELGIIDDTFIKEDIIENNLVGKKLKEKYKHLTIDTKYFKDLELDIISLFDNLDKSLDGWLIKSENYQALNTILPKFKEKVQTIYIDPPFNTGEDFPYIDRYQDSSWLSLMENRLMLSKFFLNTYGSYFINLDENADFLGRILIEKLCFEEVKKITFDTNATKDEEADLFGYKSFGKNFALKSSTIYFCKNMNSKFYKLWKPNRNLTKLNIGWLDLIAFPKKDRSKFNKIDDFDYFVEKYNLNGSLEYFKIDIDEKIYPIGDIWNDIYSFTQSEMRISENLSFLTQKPENFLRRIIQVSSTQKDIILDFFGGSGTTYAVAHKLNRRWLGVEMGEYFYEFYEEWDKTQNKFIKKLGILGRLKNVLYGDKKFKAVEKERRSSLSKDINWQGGGFFKYYELEQYEDTLRNSKYEDGDLLLIPGKDIYSQYIFMKDKKMLDKLELDYKNNKVKVNLNDIYPNIDIAETLSNLKGKWIKKITQEEVEFEDGEIINIKDLDYKLIKPLIWW